MVQFGGRGAEKLGPMAGQTAPKRRGKICSRGGCFLPGPPDRLMAGYHTRSASAAGMFCLQLEAQGVGGAALTSGNEPTEPQPLPIPGGGCCARPCLPVSMPAAWVQASRQVTRVGEKGDNLSPFFVTRVGEKGDTMSDKRETWCLPNYPVRTNQSSTTPAREDKKSRSRRSCRAGPPGRIR